MPISARAFFLFRGAPAPALELYGNLCYNPAQRRGAGQRKTKMNSRITVNKAKREQDERVFRI